ncbi:alkaline phosphatase family protein [Leucobacter massiliensis]|nr:nucleotide pyrophosphatase/phosphodiesterase family protein [Leucobacter massiliensis]
MTADNGARLAAILPSGLASVARGLGAELPEPLRFAEDPSVAERLPALRSFVLVVVDGLGHANLSAVRGHAPTLAGLQRRRIETVAPSTTGAALTTLTTGRLPGEHGLVGYRIRHPRLGLVTTLRDWEGIDDRAHWQRGVPLFGLAAELGARAVAIGRPAHASGGLTEAILSGAEYLPGARIEDRFALASALLRGGDPAVAYLYVDELDKAGHEHGWQSDKWLRRLEQLDGALAGFLRSLPGHTGVVVTADHGMVDVEPHQQIVLDEDPGMLEGVAEVGGEPRFRSLYLEDPARAPEVAARWAASEGDRAWVATREEAVASGCFGPLATGVADRLGDVLLAARRRVAYYSSADEPRSRAMIGQHGSFTEDERGVPLALGGALAGGGFGSAVAAAARLRHPA